MRARQELLAQKIDRRLRPRGRREDCLGIVLKYLEVVPDVVGVWDDPVDRELCAQERCAQFCDEFFCGAISPVIAAACFLQRAGPGARARTSS